MGERLGERLSVSLRSSFRLRQDGNPSARPQQEASFRRRRMWLPRPSKVLENGTLAGDLANLWMEIKLRMQRALRVWEA